MHCSIQNSITHPIIFTLKLFWCNTHFRAKSQTLLIVTWIICLTLNNLSFIDLYVLTATGSTIINQKLAESMFAPGAVAMFYESNQVFDGEDKDQFCHIPGQIILELG